ncbi:hypothetical protein IV203_009650 [Nitzschia inconspicua]|uniref:Uncharacterized protein n=1 Tax=Nitzschia inconspicua TaxID=303405 RepID=A0A9K3PK53_9STRA|nr:hypothetical protein IV203_009633 [Nitzschia inconspicua]KAG7350290.1 hypothetical protein IV203_009650 [Nitzschia inconspicua]
MADPNHEYLTMAEQEELQLLKRGYLEPTMIPNGSAGGLTLRNRRSCDPLIVHSRFDGRGNLRDTVNKLKSGNDRDRQECKLYLLLKATREKDRIIFTTNDNNIVEVEFWNVEDDPISKRDMVALIKTVKATWEENADRHRDNKAAAAATITRWVARHHHLMFLKKAAAATISRWAARHYRWKALKKAAAATISRWAARYFRLRALKMTAGLDVEASSTGIPLEDSPSPVRIDSIETPPVANEEVAVVQDVPSMPQEIYDDAADIITVEDGSNVPTVVKGNLTPVATGTNHSDEVNESMDSLYDCIPELPPDRDVEASSTGIPLEDCPSPVQIGRMESPPVANEEVAVVQDVPSRPEEPLVAMETTSSIEQENLGIANDETRTPVHPPSEAESEDDPFEFAATFAFLKDLLESE